MLSEQMRQHQGNPLPPSILATPPRCTARLASDLDVTSPLFTSIVRISIFPSVRSSSCKLCRRHLRRITFTEQSSCAFLRLSSLPLLHGPVLSAHMPESLSPYSSCAAFPRIHLIYFLQRKERKHTNTFQNVCIRNISPILIKIKRRCFIWVKPYST